MRLKKSALLFRRIVIACALTCTVTSSAWADEVQIRKNLPERLPKLPAIDEVSKTPINGLYEVRVGGQLLYTDEEANHLLEGRIFDTQAKADLTQARRVALSSTVDFSKLPLTDAFVWKSGTGARRLAVFSDPNCGYCKRLEVELRKLKNVSIYTFLLPVLGADSVEKSQQIWCAKDKTETWLAWMLNAKVPPTAPKCDTSAIDRNRSLAAKHMMDGTPALVFTDNTSVRGAMSAEDIEKKLQSLGKP
jgi:thiol:disulfide interchange protein DsbC